MQFVNNVKCPLKVTTSQTDETAAGANTYQFGDYIGLTGQQGRFFATWTDRRNGGYEEIWGAPLAIPSCEFKVNKSTFGQDEITAQPSWAPAFWLAVDGCFHEWLGFNSQSDLSNPLIQRPPSPPASMPRLTRA